jgi:hypothetical protein
MRPVIRSASISENKALQHLMGMLMVRTMSNAPTSPDRYVSAGELEAYRIFAAYLVNEFGAKLIGILDRVEQDLERARKEIHWSAPGGRWNRRLCLEHPRRQS